MPAKTVVLQGIKKKFGDFSLSLDISVAEGETLVLAGPSGCGKTTALNLIAGFIKQDSGSIIIGGEDAEHLPPWKRNVAVVFQDLALFPHLSVAGNIQYGLFIRGMKKTERRRITEEALKAAHLEGFGKRRIQELSGGEKQRVAIARALAASPRLLLMDEPFSSLDGPLRKTIREEFLEIRRRSSVPCIFVTHDREEAALLGDRIALMKDGGILECGPGPELFLAPRTEFCAGFFGTGCCLPAAALGESGGGKVFIPYDALEIAGSGEEADFSWVLRKCCFEGGRWRLEFDCPGFRVSAEAGLRQKPPAPGERVGIRLNRSLLRRLTP